MKKLKILFSSLVLLSFYTTSDMCNLYKNLLLNKKKIKKEKNHKPFDNDRNSYLTRNDSFNGVDSNLINQETNKFIKTINNMNEKDIIFSPDHKENTKDLLLQICKNKSFINADNDYLNFIDKETNNLSLKSNQDIPPFPPNYDGMYFPWWNFGFDWYAYFSYKTVKRFYYEFYVLHLNILKDIINILKELLSGVSLYLISLLGLFLHETEFYASIFAFISSRKIDISGGIVVQSTALVPFVLNVWSQDEFRPVSKNNSFQVDYMPFAHDSITLCVDGESLNVIMNIWSFKNNASNGTNSVKKYIEIFMKYDLFQIDNTGAWGGIIDQDYVDLYDAILNFDYNSKYGSYLKSNVVYYVKSLNNSWKTIDIQTHRTAYDYHYWKNT